MRKLAQKKKNYRMYNETLFEVDKVIQIKWVKNRQFCYIKWKGYDEKYNTWEPRDHITFCYSYVNPEEKDDDPEYKEKVALNSNPDHHYHTRNKNRVKHFDTPKSKEKEQKEDNTHFDQPDKDNAQSQTPHTPIQEKWICDSNSQELQIKRKDAQSETGWKTGKESLVHRIISLRSDDKNQKDKRIGKVEMQDGRIAYMYESVLKERFPSKVIEFYEQQMRNRTAC